MPQPSEGGGRGSEDEEEGSGEQEKREGAAQRLLLRERTAEATGKTWTSSSPQTQGLHYTTNSLDIFCIFDEFGKIEHVFDFHFSSHAHDMTIDPQLLCSVGH